MSTNPNPNDAALGALCDVLDRWVQLPQVDGRPASITRKLDTIERLIQLARLSTGQLTNELKMRELLHLGVSIDSQHAKVSVGIARTSSPYIDNEGWHAASERTPTELQAPLLVFLLHQHVRPQQIHKTIAAFIQSIRLYVGPVDVESTLTGVPRITTNTRFAAGTLRTWGLLQNSQRVAYKSWELSHYGLLAAASLLIVLGNPQLRRRPVRRSHDSFLSEDVRAATAKLSDSKSLIAALNKICVVNSDILASLAEIAKVVSLYEELIERSPGPEHFGRRRNEADQLLGRLEEQIPVNQLADDLAVDAALRDLMR